MASSKDHAIATVGCWVKVTEQGSDEEELYQLARATNIQKNQIGEDNPMGKALIGSKPGDKVTVRGPSGPINFSVLDVACDQSD